MVEGEVITQALVRLAEQAPSLAALVFVVVWQARENDRLRIALDQSLRRERLTLRLVAKLPTSADDDESQ